MLYSWHKPEKLDDGRRDNTLIKSRDISVLTYLGKTFQDLIDLWNSDGFIIFFLFVVLRPTQFAQAREEEPAQFHKTPAPLGFFSPTSSSSLLISLLKHDFNYFLSRKIWLKRKLRRQWRDRPIWSPSEKRKLRGQWRDCLILRGSEYQRKDLYKVKIRDLEWLHGSDCSCKEESLMRKIGGDRRYIRESEMVVNVCVSRMGTKQVKLMSRLRLIMCTY